MTSSSHPLHDGSLDPLALLLRARGGDDLRDTKLRLLWLRQREPEARIRTRLVSLDDRGVVMSARIELPGGGSAAAHAASSLADGGIDQVIAETELRALAGALDELGYIVVETEGDRAPSPEPDEPVPAPEIGPVEPPRRQPPGHVQAIRSLREREQQASPAGPDERRDAGERPAPTEPTPARSPQRGPAPVDRRPPSAETAPVDLSERRRPAAPDPVVPSPAVADDAEPELEDISWTAFWEWARATYQIRSRGQVEELLGAPVDRKSPGELRQMLISHFGGDSGGKP